MSDGFRETFQSFIHLKLEEGAAAASAEKHIEQVRARLRARSDRLHQWIPPREELAGRRRLGAPRPSGPVRTFWTR